MLMGGSFKGWGQYSITGVGTGNTYVQDFNSFAGTLATLPTNWTWSWTDYTPGGYYNRNGTYSNTNSTYGLRESSSPGTDIAFGGKIDANTYYLIFSGVNNTGNAIGGFTITWNVEQYSASTNATPVNFSYRINGGAYGTTGLTGTTLTTASTLVTGANLPSITSTSRSITITGLNLANAGTVDFRFSIGNGTANNAHIGVDDFTVYATAVGNTAPTLGADGTNNTVDNNIDITFTDDATWRAAVTTVKIGGTALTVTTDYVLSAGNLKLLPSGGNSLLTTAGSKSVTVEATGYTVASVTQEINAGAVTTNSTATINTALGLNTTRTVTCTAKDQYNNLVSGYTFKWDGMITDANPTTDESYTIDGSAYTASTSNVNLVSATNASGVATFNITIPAIVDAGDGVSVQVQLADGSTNIGLGFAYTKAAPQITLTGTDPGSADFQQGATNNVLYRIQVDVVNDVTNLTELDWITDGNYVAADIVASGFNLWHSTDNTFGSDTKLAALSSSSIGTGEILTFTGFNQQFAIGTAYLFITADVAANATAGHTLAGETNANEDFTFSGGATFSGSTFGSGNVHTLSLGPSVLEPGDIAIIEFNSTNPDKFSFLTFVDLSPNTVINFTDNGYNDNTTVRNGEGFLTFTAPTLISAGTVVSWYNGMTISGTGWGSNSPANFALALGDQLFAYQGTWGSGHTLIYGLNSGNSGWIISGTASSNTSYLPATLTDGDHALSFTSANGNYTLIQSGTKHALKSFIANGGNQWNQSSSSIATPAWNFIFSNSTILNANVNVINLFIDASESISIPTNINLTISGTLTNNAAEGIVLKSPLDHGAPGSLIVNGSVSGSGTIKAERYIQAYSAPGNGWHLISSPVNNVNIASGTNLAPGETDDLYAFNETAYEWTNYKPGDVFTTMENGKGYLVSYAAAATKQFVGTPNNAAVTFTNLSKTAGEGNGWHLIGNPFQSAISWNDGGWTLTNIGGVAKRMSDAGSYTDVQANDIIPAMQGFFVQAENATNTLTIPLSARTHNSAQNWTKSGNANTLLLVAHDPAQAMYQESRLNENPAATEAYDYQYDSRFVPWYAPEFYSISGNEQLSTNSIPDFSSDDVIPFGFKKNGSAAYYIELKESPAGLTTYLTDTKTGIEHNFADNAIYSFTAAEGDSPTRFLLHFGAVGVSEQPESSALKAYVVGGQLYFALQGEAILQIVDLQGRVLQQSHVVGQGLTSTALQQPAGAYVVRLMGSHSVQTAKVIVK